MTYYYWGFTDTGKNHLRLFAKANDKIYLMFKGWDEGNQPFRSHFCQTNSATSNVSTGNVATGIVKHITETHYRETNWNDQTYIKRIYHNNNGLRVSDISNRQIFSKFTGIGHLSQIHPNDLKGGITIKNKTNLSDEDIKKYSDVKYIGTEIYRYICSRYTSIAFQPLTREVVGNQWDEILEDVDCMQVDEHLRDWIVDDLVPYFREGTNLVPFKSDHLDNYISKLDGFADFIPEINYRGSLFDAYEKDKEFVWMWLDQWNIKLKNIVDKLRERKIPFTYFDLDKDSYKDVFKGWDYEIPRDFSHRRKFWITGKDFEKRYSKVKSIAEEYIELRKLDAPVLY